MAGQGDAMCRVGYEEYNWILRAGILAKLTYKILAKIGPSRPGIESR